jgi:hypothetical protein
MKRAELTTRVADWRGAPALFINDQPDTGLMLYHNNPERGHEEIADFARAGINLLTVGFSIGEMLQPDGTIDTSALDARMNAILKANPKALVLGRLLLYPPTWWIEKNPGEAMVHYDPYLDANVESEYRSVSFASQKWRSEIASAMRIFIRYCEETYGAHILGYHLGGGECGEWAYAWRHYTQSDYSVPQRDAFRRWLGDESAEIPRDWRRKPDESGEMDPVRDALLIKYMEFHSYVVADAILHFARHAKEELLSSGCQKVIAVFYGYHATPPGNPSAFFNSGHHALKTVLDSMDVDIFCAPYSYEGREAGGAYYSQFPAASAREHGKLFYSEDDTVTHVVPPHEHRYHCPDLWTTVNVLRRNALGAISDGGTEWFMDWCGQNWYRDADLMESISALQGFAREQLVRDRASVAEIAVFGSAQTVARWKHDPELINSRSLDRMKELWKIGTPLDFFLMDDFAAVHSRYRLIVLLDVPGEHLPSGDHLIFSHGFPFDHDALRRSALAVGVHLYSNAGNQVLAGRDWIAIHAGSDGDHVVNLPRASTVREAFSGRLVAQNASKFSSTLKTGETATWILSS